MVATATERARKWREENPERFREHQRKSYIKNRGRILEQRRAFRNANPERTRAWYRKRDLPAPTRPEPSVCESCGRPPNGRGALHLDHDHKTGKFRGWLCASCNKGLGMLGDDRAAVVRILTYLDWVQ